VTSSYDLVTLSDLKGWLGIEGADDDDLLSALISQISRGILNYLNRPSLVPTTYMDVIDGTNKASVLLRYWPVQSISSCVIDDRSIPRSLSFSQTGFVLEPPGFSPPGSMQRLSLRHDVFHQGVQNITISYFAGYQFTETFSVPETAPFSITLDASLGMPCSNIAVIDSNGRTLSLAAQDPDAGQYTIASQTYSFNAADAGLMVDITYGYVPADIAMAAKEWAAERYSYRSRIGQSSKSLGGQETVAFIVKDIPDFVARILQPYRCVVTP